MQKQLGSAKTLLEASIGACDKRQAGRGRETRSAREQKGKGSQKGSKSVQNPSWQNRPRQPIWVASSVHLTFR